MLENKLTNDNSPNFILIVCTLLAFRLRTLSDSGAAAGAQGPSLLPPPSSSAQPPPHPPFPPVHYKLAEHRYGREEMLALYTAKSSITVDLSDTSLMLQQPELPHALLPMSEEEQV